MRGLPYWALSGNYVSKREFSSSQTPGPSGTGAYIRPVIEIAKANLS